MKRILFVASERDVPGNKYRNNGQSIITARVYELLSGVVEVKTVTHGSWGRQLDIVFRLLLVCSTDGLCGKERLAYLVLSRSWFGLLRDSVLLCLMMRFGYKVLIHIHGRSMPELPGEIFQSVIRGQSRSNQVRLVLPSRSFFRCNKGWRAIGYKEIHNFTQAGAKSDGLACISNKESGMTGIKEVEKRKRIRVAWNSNLIYSKGIVLLLEAICLFNSKSETHYITAEVFGGLAPDRFCTSSELRTIVELMSVGEDVVLRGEVTRQETMKSLSESDVYIFPSFYESEYQPLALIDAMAAGLPILCTSLSVLDVLLEDYEMVRYVGHTGSQLLHDSDKFFELHPGTIQN